MSQTGAVPPVHSRRHRPEMNQNATSEPITAPRFGETEWEARDVSSLYRMHWVFVFVFCLHLSKSI